PRAESLSRVDPRRLTPRLHEPLNLIVVEVLHGLRRLGRVLLQELHQLAAVTVLERCRHTEGKGIQLRKSELALEAVKFERDQRVLLRVLTLRSHGLLNCRHCAGSLTSHCAGSKRW